VKGLENDKVIGRGRPREPLNGISDDVISGEKVPLGRIMRNFRLRMSAPLQGAPFGVT
jgi:hypothetical protein